MSLLGDIFSIPYKIAQEAIKNLSLYGVKKRRTTEMSPLSMILGSVHTYAYAIMIAALILFGSKSCVSSSHLKSCQTDLSQCNASIMQVRIAAQQQKIMVMAAEKRAQSAYLSTLDKSKKIISAKISQDCPSVISWAVSQASKI